MNSQSRTMTTAGTATLQAAPHDDRVIRLLPRHWEWLEAQPRSASASLRLLVDEARRDKDGRYRIAKAKEDCYLYMRDMAGDRPHFEEAVRALFADDVAALQLQMASWPVDIQRHIHQQLSLAWPSPAVEGGP